ncbi:MAG TPA: hypothetical protein VEX18_12605, partial [Polyangiaceae bacterium]|nr:hypothetical protein [Polyangiaceae bacterium]
MRAPTLLVPFVATAVLVLAKPAEATGIYVEVVSDTLMMPCVPQCFICHATNDGGLDTVVKPFGMKAMALGLK